MGNCWPLPQTKPHHKPEWNWNWWRGGAHRRKKRKERKQLSVAGGRREKEGERGRRVKLNSSGAGEGERLNEHAVDLLCPTPEWSVSKLSSNWWFTAPRPYQLKCPNNNLSAATFSKYKHHRTELFWILSGVKTLLSLWLCAGKHFSREGKGRRAWKSKWVPDSVTERVQAEQAQARNTIFFNQEVLINSSDLKIN